MSSPFDDSCVYVPEGDVDDAEDVKFQEILGSVSSSSTDDPCFVFAQGWPSWAFALDGLGVSNITTSVQWHSPSARKEFESLSLGSGLLPQQKALALLQSHVKVRTPHVFIQGSPSFLSRMLDLLPSSPVINISIMLGSEDVSTPLSPVSVRAFPQFAWRQISHKSCAGVTKGTWMFGSTLDYKSNGGIPNCGLRRTLRHVLKDTVYGSPHDSSSISPRPVLPSQRAPFGQAKFTVRSQCVFHPNELVTRPVTTSELMSIYDLEENLQTSLRHFWSSSKVGPSFAFVHQTPIKVLVTCARSLLRLRPQSEPVDAPSGSPTGDPSVVVPTISLQSELPAAPSTFGMESDDPPVHSLADIKAVKHDDAQVNERDWNEWTINNYEFSADRPQDRPKICIPNSYNQNRAHFFDLMRKLMHRAYKRRLLRGFLTHMHQEHGSTPLPHARGGGMGGTSSSTSPSSSGARVPWSVFYSATPGGPRTIQATVEVSAWCLSPLAGKGSKKRVLNMRTRDDDLVRDLNRGRDCLERAMNSTFWEWSDGSSIFFWRWPRRYKKALRDGTKLFVNAKMLPSFCKKQRLPTDPATREKLLNKLQVPRGKRYIVPGEVLSRTGFFDVPKGENDIRIVYDATACGLNKALWSPNFYLPTIDALLRNADADTYYGDIDLGEMFLNYALDEAIRPYAGVDVTALMPEVIRKKMGEVIERWERTLMGLRPSPYVCTQTFSWGEEIIRGNRLAKGHPLRWDRVVLNLPGDKNYDPSRPWVYKWNDETQSLAGSFGTYVDDIRTQHQSERLCRATTRTVAAGVGYLGQQDAPRKRRPPSQRPGAWSGAMCFSKEGEGLYVTCSQEKWDKGKALIEKWYKEVVIEGKTNLHRADLEKGVGFLVHLSRTFPALFPYFKGIYLTMESWREGRNEDGWKFSRKAWWNLMAGAFKDEDDGEKPFDPDLSFEENKRRYLAKVNKPQPSDVKAVKRLARDLTSLRKLFAHDVPPKRLVRGNSLKQASYGFGDASGGGFGSSWEESDGKIKFRAGTWGREGGTESSNWRELKNLVDSLKEMAKDGKLVGVEAFIFTDNTTAENAFFKGTSASPKLFELLLELRELEMSSCCKIHLVHVAGTRMINQGTDGLSRGNFTEGSMKGNSIFDYIPLKESALERSPNLRMWLDTWDSDLEYLNPEGWFERGHDLVPGGEKNCEGHWIPKFESGKFIWSPPPAAAEVAVEELRKARHKRQDSTHVFIVPRLMKPYWHKQLCKVADVVLTLPVGHPAWPVEMHEPLTIAVCFPYLNYRPWELRRAPKLLDLASKLQRVWKTDPSSEGPLLQQLWSLPGKLERMPPFMARQVLQGMPVHSVRNRPSRKRSRYDLEK